MNTRINQWIGPGILVLLIGGTLVISGALKRRQQVELVIPPPVPIHHDDIVESVTLVRSGAGELPPDIAATYRTILRDPLLTEAPFWCEITASLRGETGPQQLPVRCRLRLTIGEKEYSLYRAGAPDSSYAILNPGLGPLPGAAALHFADPAGTVSKRWPVAHVSFAKRIVPTSQLRSVRFSDTEYRAENVAGAVTLFSHPIEKNLSTVFISEIANSYEELRPIYTLLIPIQTETNWFLPTKYPNQVDSVRLLFERTVGQPLKSVIRFPGITIREKYGQKFLDIPKHSSVSPVPGVSFSIVSLDPPPNRPGGIKDYTRIALNSTGKNVFGKVIYLSPEPGQVGLKLSIEAKPGFTVTDGRNGHPIKQGFKIGQVFDLEFQLKAHYEKVVESKTCDLAVIRGSESASKR